MVRRAWGTWLGLVMLLVGALGCGSRTGLGGFGGQQGGSGGSGGAPATGGAFGSGGAFGTGGVFATGGAFGTGGSFGTGGVPGSGGGGHVALDCPTQELGVVEHGQKVTLEVATFATQPLASSRWVVRRDDCDAILPQPTFTAVGTGGPVFDLTPGRPGLYRIALEVETLSGEQDSCELVVRYASRGVRVDLCWDTSTTVDVDLYVHTPLNQKPYYGPGGSLEPTYLASRVTEDTCNPANCGPFVFDARPLFELPDSPLEFCEAGPSAADYFDAGHCPNPRSGRDNNQSDATGTSEIVQIDNPRDGDVYRVMVQNYDNAPAVPHVFIYCGEEQVFVGLPGAPDSFVTDQERLPGVLWRAADINTFTVSDRGGMGCFVTPLEHPNFPETPYVTVNEIAY